MEFSIAKRKFYSNSFDIASKKKYSSLKLSAYAMEFLHVKHFSIPALKKSLNI